MSTALMHFVLVVHSLIAIALVAVILLQRSEGGALGIGGGPGGLLTARGAGNLLTKSTGVLAALFLSTSILLAVLASLAKAPTTIDTSLVPTAEAPAAPADGLPTALPGTAPADDALPMALPPAPASDDIPTAQ
ncbi:preprotein translocase subunit SecG [Sphingosinicella sp.]|jgi:preprotein translocase subunit SecG|uniref:preprotein translocase subunit SecG n=1 Tax=Sphingosinicella sp. TaxID=1917971 RepID=UPI0018293579|nr:preprotein translocase subunit SecG [Sphingosinicella sp.]MBA4757182.1 preprotein translocase subunit SecG [Sphingosinicella sp.]MEA3538010.1 preprotein translocase subunit SecG [Pseudomonadota bacterium]